MSTQIDPVIARITLGIQRITRGWTQGTYQNHKGEVCMLGSIQYTRFRPDRTAIEAKRYLQRAIGGRYSTIAAYNDNRRRTKEQVLKMMTKALLLRAQAIT